MRAAGTLSGEGRESLRVATTVMHCSEEPEANRRKMALLVQSIAAAHPDVRLILFGELCLGWFWHGERRGRPYEEITAESLEYHQRIAEPIPGPTTDFVSRLAKEHRVYIAFGMGELAEDAPHESPPYNAMVLVGPAGAVVAKRRQLRLACGMFQASGEMATIANVEGERIAMLICSDARSMALLRSIRRARPHIVLHALAAPQRDVLFARAMAAFFGAWVVTSNRIGGEPEPPSRYPGTIAVVAPRGRVVGEQLGREGYLIVDIPRARPRRPALRVLARAASDLACMGVCLQLLLGSVKSALRRAVSTKRGSAHS